MDYKVPMKELPVTVALSETEPAEYFIYLSPFSHRHSGYETVEEYLNSSRAFFPMTAHGVPKIINRHQMLWMRTSTDEAPPSKYEMDEAHIILEMVDGMRVEGGLEINRPVGQARVSDILNDGRELFICVRDDADMYFVNKSFIRQVILR